MHIVSSLTLVYFWPILLGSGKTGGVDGYRILGLSLTSNRDLSRYNILNTMTEDMHRSSIALFQNNYPNLTQEKPRSSAYF